MAYDIWQGLAVIDWSEDIAGAFCARLLADMGARVIKIELPAGDKVRKMGPFPDDLPNQEKSGLFLTLNSNKLGMTLNPFCETGRSFFMQMVKDADVLVVDRSPAELEERGFNYESLREVNPRLVMTSITPFGSVGPYRDYLATDLTIFHMCAYARGMLRMHLIDPDPDARVPVRAQWQQVGLIGGLAGSTATSLALLQRDSTGEGASVEVSLWEAMCMMNSGGYNTTSYGQQELVDPRPTNKLRGSVSTKGRVLPTNDGYATVLPRVARHWESWIDLVGAPEWAKEERFVRGVRTEEELQELQQKERELVQVMEEWTRQRSKNEVFNLGVAVGIPVFPVNTIADLFHSPHLAVHLAERGFFRTIEHPVAGSLPYPGTPFKIDGVAPTADRPAPLLGEHTEKLLGELGISRQKLVKLRALGVI
jgi:crotonobetainyl-CoA:carnitine CoA-transferase CaiB-like acyl-CoA transferase